MKTKVIIFAIMLISTVSIAQKKELKKAEKALKSGNIPLAKNFIDAASPLIEGQEKYKAQYYFLKANTYFELAKKGKKSFKSAIDTYKMLFSYEADKKQKYSPKAQENLNKIASILLEQAIKDNENKNFKSATEKLYMRYNLNKKDTIYLYFAASTAVNAKLYEDALKYYIQLRDLNYDGVETEYYAKHVASGEKHKMNSKTHQDLMVKSKEYTEPSEKMTASKKAEIIKNIALIYSTLNQEDKALEAYADARKSNPKDITLILNQANMYLKMGNKEKFKTLMQEGIKIAPKNPDLFYNIGVINSEQKNYAAAKDAYKKTIEIDPKYINAYINLSTAFLDEGNALVDQMNALGRSESDGIKYKELKDQKDMSFKKAAEVLEDALKINVGNQGILTSLRNIYGALGDTANFKRVKKLIKD